MYTLLVLPNTLFKKNTFQKKLRQLLYGSILNILPNINIIKNG